MSDRMAPRDCAACGIVRSWARAGVMGGGQWVSAECDGAARCLGRLLYRNKNLKTLPSTLGNLKKLETL